MGFRGCSADVNPEPPLELPLSASHSTFSGLCGSFISYRVQMDADDENPIRARVRAEI